MSTIYNIEPYSRGILYGGLRPCDTNYTATLAANTNERLAVPGGAGMGLPGAIVYNNSQSTNTKYLALIVASNAANVYFTIGAPGSTPTAAVPAGGTFVASASVLLPPAIPYLVYVYAGQVMAFITPAGANPCDVSVSFYTVSDT